MEDEEFPSAAAFFASLRNSGSITHHAETTFPEWAKVIRRAKATAKAFEDRGLRYAVIGGIAAAYYASLVDEGAVRTTPEVNILINESDFHAARECLAKIGYEYHFINETNVFLDSGCSPRSGVRLHFASTKIRPDYVTPAPDLSEIESTSEGFAVIPFQKLVEMKLNANRTKDRMHILDLIGVGLITAEVIEKTPKALRPRLQYLVDNPES